MRRASPRGGLALLFALVVALLAMTGEAIADVRHGLVDDPRDTPQAIEKSGVPRVRFHDLRHTFGTRLAAAGIPIRTIQEWMGHSDAKTTAIYTHHQPNGHDAELVERAFSSTTLRMRFAASLDRPKAQ